MGKTEKKEAELDLRKPKTMMDWVKRSFLFLVVVGLATLLVLQIIILWGTNVPEVVPPGNLVGPESDITPPAPTPSPDDDTGGDEVDDGTGGDDEVDDGTGGDDEVDDGTGGDDEVDDGTGGDDEVDDGTGGAEVDDGTGGDDTANTDADQ